MSAHISMATALTTNLGAKNVRRCATVPEPQKWRGNRRLFSFSISLLFSPSLSSSLPARISSLFFCAIFFPIFLIIVFTVGFYFVVLIDAIGDNIFDRYVKRKKLEPLETYVPAVILTQFQIEDIEKSLEVDQPQYAAYRTALRSGPAASFRSNVRAVAQYASNGGNGKTAFDDAERCLRALDELDSLFLRASRNNPAASAKLMKEKIVVAVNALDSLLQTVPSDVLNKGKAIADAYRKPEIDVEPQELDPELKELQSIL